MFTHNEWYTVNDNEKILNHVHQSISVNTKKTNKINTVYTICMDLKYILQDVCLFSPFIHCRVT